MLTKFYREMTTIRVISKEWILGFMKDIEWFVDNSNSTMSSAEILKTSLSLIGYTTGTYLVGTGVVVLT